MRWVDVAIVVIIGGSAIFGLVRGLIVQVGGVLGAVAGLYLARHDYGAARDFLALFFHNDAHLSVVAFILVFLIVGLLVVIIAHGIKSVVRFTPLGMLDHFAGAALGVALGILVVEVLVLLASESHDASLRASLHASRLAPTLDHAIPGLRSLIPKSFPKV